MPLTYWSRSCLPIDKGLIDVFKRSDNGSRILRVVCCHTTILERNHHLDQRQQRLTSRSLESSSATVIAMPRLQTARDRSRAGVWQRMDRSSTCTHWRVVRERDKPSFAVRDGFHSHPVRRCKALEVG